MTTTVLYVGTYTQKLDHVHGKGAGIYSFALDPRTGALRPLAATTEGVGPNPSYLTGTRRAIYAVNETDAPQVGRPEAPTGYVQALAIEPEGRLRPLNRLETAGAYPCHVAVNRTESLLAVANYGGGNLSVFPIHEADGSLLPATDARAFDGASLAVPERQEAPHVHSTTWLIDPNDNKCELLVAADLGNDRLMQFKVSGGKLSAAHQHARPGAATVATASRPAGSGPRHVALHPTLRIAYVLDELSSTIGVHALDVTTGALAPEATQNISTLPDAYAGPSNLGADVHVSSCGSFLYASNRGHDSIACYRIDPRDDGRLAVVGWEPTRGRVPRSFLVHGDLVLVANQDTDTIEVFRVDPATGRLAHTGHNVACPTPVSLFIPRA